MSERNTEAMCGKLTPEKALKMMLKRSDNKLREAYLKLVAYKQSQNVLEEMKKSLLQRILYSQKRKQAQALDSLTLNSEKDKALEGSKKAALALLMAKMASNTAYDLNKSFRNLRNRFKEEELHRKHLLSQMKILIERLKTASRAKKYEVVAAFTQKQLRNRLIETEFEYKTKNLVK